MKAAFTHISTTCIFIVFLLKAMALPLIVLQYNLNKEYIANNLCENRAKPQLQCQGTCHLSKQLAKSVENSESQDTKTSVKIISVDCFDSITTISFDNNFFSLNTYQQPADITRILSYTSAIFHPPC